MRRKILLESLSVGRCFTLALEPGGSTETESETLARRSDSVLTGEDAWKVVEDKDAEFVAESARGVRKGFPKTSEVVEIPRQGYERLVQRG